jgi:hypothetical protein
MKLVLEGEAHEVLRGETLLGQSPEPHREALPAEGGEVEGQPLQDAQGDSREVDEALIGFELAIDLRAELGARSMEVEVAIAPGDFGHGLHPEGIAEGKQDVHQGFEANLDLEPQGVGIEDGLGAKVGISGDKNRTGSVGIEGKDEAYPKTLPEEVEGVKGDVLEVAVKLERGRLKELGVLEQLSELDLGAILARPATGSGAGGRWGSFVGHGGRAYFADVVEPCSYQGTQEAVSRVVGIGHDRACLVEGGGNQGVHFVDEGGSFGGRALETVMDLQA